MCPKGHKKTASNRGGIKKAVAINNKILPWYNDRAQLPKYVERKDFMLIKNDDISSLSHTKWNCQYHIVFTPKYRRKAIYGKLRSNIGKYLRRLCEYKEDLFSSK